MLQVYIILVLHNFNLESQYHIYYHTNLGKAKAAKTYTTFLQGVSLILTLVCKDTFIPIPMIQ